MKYSVVVYCLIVAVFLALQVQCKTPSFYGIGSFVYSYGDYPGNVFVEATVKMDIDGGHSHIVLNNTVFNPWTEVLLSLPGAYAFNPANNLYFYTDDSFGGYISTVQLGDDPKIVSLTYTGSEIIAKIDIDLISGDLFVLGIFPPASKKKEHQLIITQVPRFGTAHDIANLNDYNITKFDALGLPNVLDTHYESSNGNYYFAYTISSGVQIGVFELNQHPKKFETFAFPCIESKGTPHLLFYDSTKDVLFGILMHGSESYAGYFEVSNTTCAVEFYWKDYYEYLAGGSYDEVTDTIHMCAGFENGPDYIVSYNRKTNNITQIDVTQDFTFGFIDIQVVYE